LSSTSFAPFAARTVGSNVTGGWHPGDPASTRDLLWAQLTTWVHWAENFRSAVTAGGRIFIEVGPGKTLSSLCQASSTDDNQRITSFSVDCGRNAADLAWLQTLARLAVHGVPVHDPLARVPERIHLQSNGDSLPSADTDIGSSAGATSHSLSVHYLREAGRQVEAYFRQEDRLMATGPEPATVRLALQLNSNVVTSFLENGAQAVRASEAFPWEPEVPFQESETRQLTTVPDDRPGTEGYTELADGDDALAKVKDALASLTGFLAEEITPDMRLEDDLGIVSVALLEVLVKMGILSVDRPDTSILMDIATVRDMASFLQRGADDPAVPEDLAAVHAEGSFSAAGPMASAPTEMIRRFGFARQPVRCEGDVPTAALVVSADPKTADEIRRGLAAGGCAVTVWLAEGHAFVADGQRYPVDSPSMSDALGKILGSGPMTVLFATGQNPEISARVEASGLALSSLARAVSAHRAERDGDGVRLGILVAPGSAPEAVMAIGYARALQKEWPDTPVRAIRDEGPAGCPLDVVGLAVALSNGPSDTHLVRDAGSRNWREVHLPMPIRSPSEKWIGESGHGAVLATGGGDGITAEVVVAIAERYRCPVAVLGRTDFPADGNSGRAEAIRRTSERVGAVNGAEFMYCQADVTDAEQVRTAVQRVRDRFGSVRGVILGAGVMTEARIEVKTAEAETQTLNTKIEQVRIFREIFQGDDEIRFALLFSSIASYTGNVAQADYVAANLAFEELGAEWNRASAYPVRSLLWSIWDETGLAPSWLRRAMRDTGVQGIKNSVGAELLLDELGCPHDPPDRVLLAPESVLNYLMAARNE
jgi:acyl transferase domain-containing protein